MALCGRWICVVDCFVLQTARCFRWLDVADGLVWQMDLCGRLLCIAGCVGYCFALDIALSCRIKSRKSLPNCIAHDPHHIAQNGDARRTEEWKTIHDSDYSSKWPLLIYIQFKVAIAHKKKIKNSFDFLEGREKMSFHFSFEDAGKVDLSPVSINIKWPNKSRKLNTNSVF